MSVCGDDTCGGGALRPPPRFTLPPPPDLSSCLGLDAAAAAGPPSPPQCQYPGPSATDRLTDGEARLLTTLAVLLAATLALLGLTCLVCILWRRYKRRRKESGVCGGSPSSSSSSSSSSHRKTISEPTPLHPHPHHVTALTTGHATPHAFYDGKLMATISPATIELMSCNHSSRLGGPGHACGPQEGEVRCRPSATSATCAG